MDRIVGGLGAAGVIFWAIAGISLLHHKLRNSDPEKSQPLLPTGKGWFQRKDACAARCTHENWVVACILAGTACVCTAVVLETIDRATGI